MTADPEHEALLTWDYTSEVWSWSPADGPWSPAHGRPKTSGARLSASTGSLGPDDAYEFWREVVIYDFAAGRMDAEAKREFRGAGEVLAAPRGSIFTCRLGPLSGERTRAQSRADGCDEVSFGLVRKGRRRTVGPDGTVSSSEAGDFYVYDAAMPCRLEWTAHESIYLAVPRDLLRSTFGGDPLRIEAHLLDFSGDLYGLRLVVRFIERLRGEEKFPSAEALVRQIKKDEERAREIFSSLSSLC